MPLYEYLCDSCDIKFEMLRPMSRVTEDAPCPDCSQMSPRVLSVFASFSIGGSGEVTPLAGGGGCLGCGPGGCACGRSV
ncbi:MAG: zinc ribbon domain-containing protein [Chloroflexi bacterium]|nr:zinc ribbon domain-containing protein [Chloroflexota bacterium]